MCLNSNLNLNTTIYVLTSKEYYLAIYLLLNILLRLHVGLR